MSNVGKRKILVTGTAGFIGYHLALRLLEEGNEVVGIDNINDYYDVNLKFARLSATGIDREKIEPGVAVRSGLFPLYRFLRLDLEDRTGIHRLFEKERFDLVCHLAAQAGVRYSIENPMAYVQSNLVGFAHILEACRTGSVEHLVYASSSSVYGLNTRMPFSTRDNVDHPISLYAASKKCDELLAHAYSYLYGIPTTGLRFFSVYGPWGRPDMALFKFTRAILAGEPIEVYNGGEMLRDFTYVDDIIEAISRVLSFPPRPNSEWDAAGSDPSSSIAPYRIYNIGGGHPQKLSSFIAQLEKTLDRKARIEYRPVQLGDILATSADVEDLVRDFDFRPQTGIKEGIRAFVLWYLGYYGNAAKTSRGDIKP
jgi:UDP-glucuronate 4-epimerase